MHGNIRLNRSKVYDRYIYSDTDSLHLMGTDIPENIEVNSTKLGAWKLEHEFTRGRYIKAKTYRLQYKCTYGPEEIETKAAGMGEGAKPFVTLGKFSHRFYF